MGYAVMKVWWLLLQLGEIPSKNQHTLQVEGVLHLLVVDEEQRVFTTSAHPSTFAPSKPHGGGGGSGSAGIGGGH